MVSVRFAEASAGPGRGRAVAVTGDRVGPADDGFSAAEMETKASCCTEPALLRPAAGRAGTVGDADDVDGEDHGTPPATLRRSPGRLDGTKTFTVRSGA